MKYNEVLFFDTVDDAMENLVNCFVRGIDLNWGCLRIEGKWVDVE